MERERIAPSLKRCWASKRSTAWPQPTLFLEVMMWDDEVVKKQVQSRA
jgi:hypothetical protein